MCPFCSTQRVIRCFALSISVLVLACGDARDSLSDDGGTDAATTTGPAANTTDATTDSPPAMTLGMSATSLDTGDGDGGGAESSIDDGVDDSAETSGYGFIYDDPDDGGRVTFECDLFAQDCPEGEKCMPWANDGGAAWNATRCSPLHPDPGQPADPCIVDGSPTSGIDDCDIGVMCWNVDAETNAGTCVSMCDGDEAQPLCEDAAAACVIANDGAIVLCLPRCHPLVQDCAEGLGCFPVAEDFVCVPQAPGPDYLDTFGEPCNELGACEPGTACLDAAATTVCEHGACCVPFCDVTDADADAQCAALDPGTTCEPWYQPKAVPEGYEDVGACVVPQ